MVQDINPNEGSRPYCLTAYSGKLYFSADDGTYSDELWVSDGTTAGTQMVQDINPSGASNPYYFTIYKGKLYFSADDGTYGHELWVSDGTTAGTQLVKDIYPNEGSGAHRYFTAYNGKLYFMGYDDTNGYELWVSDGTTAGTQMIKDINPNGDGTPGGFTGGGILGGFTEYNGKLYFRARDGSNGYELWVSDGSTAGTKMVKDINPSGWGDPAGQTHLKT